MSLELITLITAIFSGIGVILHELHIRISEKVIKRFIPKKPKILH
jgi:hypothetical protein